MSNLQKAISPPNSLKILRCSQARVLIVLIALVAPLCFQAQEWRWDVTEDWSDIVIAPEGTTGGSLLGELRDSVGVSNYTLGVGATYYYKKFESGWVDYHDLASRHQYWFHADSTTFSRVPSHAEPDFRRTELANREFIGGVIGHMQGGENLMGSEYDLACLFGIDQDEAPAFDWIQKKNKVSGMIGDAELFNMVLSKKELPDLYSKAFELFFRYEVYLHPETIDQLVGTSKHLSELSFGIVSSMKRLSYDIEFKSLGEKTSMFDPTSRFDISNLGVFNDPNGFNLLDEAMNAVFNNRLYHDYTEMAQGYIEDSLYCDAMLATFALTLSDDPQPGELLKERVGHQADDPRLASLLTALSIRDTSEVRMKEKTDALLELRSDSTIENWHVIDVFLANAYEEAGDYQMAEDFFLDLFSVDPYLAAPYHDLGLLYTKLYQFDIAWKCFEVGMILNENHPIYADIKQRKSTLETEYSQFFLK